MIRVKSITLKNFKNTNKGTIEFLQNESKASTAAACGQGGPGESASVAAACGRNISSKTAPVTAACAQATSGKAASITGIYGQNGSSKSAIVDAFSIVQSMILTAKVPDEATELIANDSDTCSIAVDFEFDERALEEFGVEVPPIGGYESPFASQQTELSLSFTLARKRKGQGAYVARERLDIASPIMRRRTLLEYSAIVHDGQEEAAHPQQAPTAQRPLPLLKGIEQVGYTLAPAQRWRSIGAIDKEIGLALEAGQRIAYATGSSYLFSDGFSDSIVGAIQAALARLQAGKTLPKSFEQAMAQSALPLVQAIVMLKKYAATHMKVVSTVRSAFPSLDRLIVDVVVPADGDTPEKQTPVAINIRSTDVVSSDKLDPLVKTIGAMNNVLSALVPGLSVEVNNLGTETDGAGREVTRIELLSNRRGRKVPLHCESDGIKKLVSIMSQLIAVYGDENAFVVIDELDSGVFEYLLGELLEVLSGNGKGQLVFTAHNLRPLEMLPAKSIVFTTTNPDNRYIRIKGFRPTNNLRDLYIRTINLGGQDEHVYDPTSKLSIDAGFYDASHPAETDLDLDDLIRSLAQDSVKKGEGAHAESASSKTAEAHQ